jgi:uncharacterized protein YdhG (YjbR/CyaY superfamily)
MPRPTTIDEYIDNLPQHAQPHVVEIRRLAHDAAPTAIEQIKWGYPAYVHPDGVILFMFSGHKKHTSVAFTPSTRAAFDDELSAYNTGKGTIALPHHDPLPTTLLSRMIKHRTHEYEHHGTKWL